MVPRASGHSQLADALRAHAMIARKCLHLHLTAVFYHTDAADRKSIGGVRYQLVDVIGRFAVVCDVAGDVSARATLTFPCKVKFSIISSFCVKISLSNIQTLVAEFTKILSI